jgi:IS605 OrfB family transposase
MVLGGRAIVPMQMGEYQRVQFSRAKGQADLVLSTGTFYLLVTLETPEAPTMVPEQFMGVDLGIVNLAADSTGTLYSGVDVEAVRQRCQCHRASFQRTGTKSATRRLKAMAGKESRFRRWVNHQIANTLVARAKDTKSAIVLEDLTGIRERRTVRQRERNKHSGWSFRQLQDFIVYKAIRAAYAGVLWTHATPARPARGVAIVPGAIDGPKTPSPVCGVASSATPIPTRPGFWPLGGR